MLNTDPLAGTFAGLYIDGYSITVYCSPCDKRVEIDLLTLPLLQPYVKRKFRCQHCGQLGYPIHGAPYPHLSNVHRDFIEAERAKRRQHVEKLLKGQP